MSEKNYLAATRVEWRLPAGWIVWVDEDGCHVRPGSSSLEMPEVARLIETWRQAKHQWESGEVLAPRPPSPEQVQQMRAADAHRYVADRVAEALRDLNSPF